MIEAETDAAYRMAKPVIAALTPSGTALLLAALALLLAGLHRPKLAAAAGAVAML